MNTVIIHFFSLSPIPFKEIAEFKRNESYFISLNEGNGVEWIGELPLHSTFSWLRVIGYVLLAHLTPIQLQLPSFF